VPSNLALHRFGAPFWMALIVCAWGLTAIAFAGVRGVAQFYVLRLLLGAAEAGTMPGMW
jgi:MFS family permease